MCDPVGYGGFVCVLDSAGLWVLMSLLGSKVCVCATFRFEKCAPMLGFRDMCVCTWKVLYMCMFAFNCVCRH